MFLKVCDAKNNINTTKIIRQINILKKNNNKIYI